MVNVNKLVAGVFAAITVLSSGLTTVFPAKGETVTADYNAADWNGSYVRVAERYSDVDYYSIVNYEYDDNGNMISQRFEDCCSYGSIDYKYNENNGLSKKHLQYYEDSEWTYDDNGTLIKKEEKLYDGKTKTTVYCYNDAGKLFKTDSFTSSSDVSVTKYSYDAEGRVVEENVTSMVDADSVTTYSYENGRVSRKTITTTDGIDQVYTYEYNENGDIIKTTLTENFDGESTTTVTEFDYEYNENGKITKKTETDREKYSLVTEYEYDENGNMTTMIYTDGENSCRVDYLYEKLAKNACVINNNIHLQYSAVKADKKEKTPSVTIDDYNKGLDYTVTYSDNVDQGKGLVTINFTSEHATEKPITIAFDIE